MPKWFYDKEVDIYKYSEYEEDIGLPVTMTREGYIKINDAPLLADVQPYSKAEAERDYGYKVDCERKMFCDLSDLIAKDCIVKYNNEFYSVAEIPWDDVYFEILLSRTKDVNVIE